MNIQLDPKLFGDRKPVEFATLQQFAERENRGTANIETIKGLVEDTWNRQCNSHEFMNKRIWREMPRGSITMAKVGLTLTASQAGGPMMLAGAVETTVTGKDLLTGHDVGRVEGVKQLAVAGVFVVLGGGAGYGKTMAETPLFLPQPKPILFPDAVQMRLPASLERPGNLIMNPARMLEGPSQLELNQTGGVGFEILVLESLRAPKNTQELPGVVSGKSVMTIPDAFDPLNPPRYGVLEIKNVRDLSRTVQLRAEGSVAAAEGVPQGLIIGPSTKTVSVPLQQQIQLSGGRIFMYDPVTRRFYSVDFGPKPNQVRR